MSNSREDPEKKSSEGDEEKKLSALEFPYNTSDELLESSSYPPTTLVTDQGNFTLISRLGGGKDADVGLYRCENKDNATINSFADKENRVAIKIFKNVADALPEILISEGINNEIKRTRHSKPFCNSVSRLTLNQSICGAVGRYFPLKSIDSFMPVLHNATILLNELKSGELTIATSDIAATETERLDLTTKIARAFVQHPGVLLSQLTNTMKKSQNFLNKNKLLHLDTSCRNYLVGPPEFDNHGNLLTVSAVIADFTRTFQVKDGTVTLEGNLHPLKWMDSESLVSLLTDDKKATLATDLFALKATVISMLGQAIGHNKESGVLYVNDQHERIRAFVLERLTRFKNDSVMLKKYLENTVTLLASSKLTPDQQAKIKLFIECYSDFLTTMPEEDNLAIASPDSSLASLNSKSSETPSLVAVAASPSVMMEMTSPARLFSPSNMESNASESRPPSEMSSTPHEYATPTYPNISANSGFFSEMGRASTFKMKALTGDNALFKQANEKFIQKTLELEMKRLDPSKPIAMQNFMLLKTRLMVLDVSPGFKQSEFFRSLEEKYPDRPLMAAPVALHTTSSVAAKLAGQSAVKVLGEALQTKNNTTAPEKPSGSGGQAGAQAAVNNTVKKVSNGAPSKFKKLLR